MMDVIQDFVQDLLGMQWSDYLDIALVAYLIFRLMPLLRSRNVMRIARTVVLLVLVTWVTGLMKLYTLNWILTQFLTIGLLAFVVLFQPELRRMLDHLADMKLSNLLGGRKSVHEMDKVITQTVMACEAMSRQRVGALIVFSREHRLDEYFKTGTEVDAIVSEQLLRNLFFTKAALHDGAVIIQDGRVAAAGCVLPLSTSPMLSADLGTRHRASVGISEVSDGVAVVVSEETGTISVAVGGMLKRHLAPQTLEKLLHYELCPRNEELQRTNPAAKALKKISRKKEEDGYAKK
ncbi:MAG: diadenylate cyclase CdaA [Eubacteriales bacterium]|nr:diadenylate cyclase CdaA [Eubacteriales bacterium]